MKSTLLGVLAAVAAGAGAAGAIDTEQIAKLGPFAASFMLYLELRFRPLIAEAIVEYKAHRVELAAHRAELKGERSQSHAAQA